jgi:predicted DNA-binding transcriptional regulator AlpA
MRMHEFTIIASGLHPDADDVANIFFNAGCDDAVLSFQKGLLILEFERGGPTFSSALISACSDVLRTGARLERLEPDHLVSLSEIAKRTGLSRSAISLYHKGDRSSDFPTPVARITSESPLWDWHAVAGWMHERNHLPKEAVIQAKVVKEANFAFAAQNGVDDHFTRRLQTQLEAMEKASL